MPPPALLPLPAGRNDEGWGDAPRHQLEQHHGKNQFALWAQALGRAWNEPAAGVCGPLAHPCQHWVLPARWLACLQVHVGPEPGAMPVLKLGDFNGAQWVELTRDGSTWVGTVGFMPHRCAAAAPAAASIRRATSTRCTLLCRRLLPGALSLLPATGGGAQALAGARGAAAWRRIRQLYLGKQRSPAEDVGELNYDTYQVRPLAVEALGGAGRCWETTRHGLREGGAAGQAGIAGREQRTGRHAARPAQPTRCRCGRLPAALPPVRCRWARRC